MNASLTKRIIAYCIDIIIVVIIIMAIGNFIKIPEQTLKLQSTLNKLNDAVLSDEITFKDYMDGYTNIIYNVDKEKIAFSILNFIVIFLYFVIVPLITKGKTCGKYLMKIKVKNKNKDKINFLGLLIRNFIINGLGYLLIQMILVNVVKPGNYFYILTILAIIQILLVIISVFMVKYRKDKRGLHDIISGTVVINKEVI